MKPTFNNVVRADDWPKPGVPFSSRFMSNYADFIKQSYNNMNNGMTFADNMQASWIAQSCTHAMTVSLANPLHGNVRPKQIQVLPNITPIRSFVWSYTSSNAQPISLTVYYDVGEQYFEATTTSNQSIPNTTATSLTFNASLSLSYGNSVTWDGSSKMIINQAGLYEVYYQTNWAVNATGGREAAVAKNGTDNGIAWTSFQAPTVSENAANEGMAVTSLAKGDYLQVQVYQASGGALNTAAASFPLRFSVRQLSPLGINDTPSVLVIGG